MYRPNEKADWQKDWSGPYFPDKKTAEMVGKQYVRLGSKTYCHNLESFRELFPDHPVVLKVEQWEELERLKKRSIIQPAGSQWSAA
jgi:hypothetical protein